MEAKKLMESLRELWSGSSAGLKHSQGELSRLGERLRELGGLQAEGERLVREWQERTRAGWRRTDARLEGVLRDLQGLVRVPGRDELVALQGRIDALEGRIEALARAPRRVPRGSASQGVAGG